MSLPDSAAGVTDHDESYESDRSESEQEVLRATDDGLSDEDERSEMDYGGTMIDPEQFRDSRNDMRRRLLQTGVDEPEATQPPSTDELPLFYEAPEKEWHEPQIEQLITYSGNVRNYYMQGMGQRAPDRDMTALLEHSDQAKLSLPQESNERLLEACDAKNLMTLPTYSCLRTHDEAEKKTTSMNPSDDGKSITPYRALPTDQHIRLLEILPGTGARLECIFHIVSLEEATNQYEALSYTWDTEWAPGFEDKVDEMPEVFCDGIAMPIKPNLHMGLQMLQRPDQSRVVWADALCINQEDMGERSSQVSLMSQIFRSAFRVVIWLGLSEEDTRGPKPRGATIPLEPSYKACSGVCAVVHLWAKWKGLKGVDARFLAPDPFHDEAERRGQGPSHDLVASSPIWYEIFLLYRSRWFSRLWVVQEALLAQSTTVVWGHCFTSWELIGLAASIIRTNFNRLDLNFSSQRAVPTGVLNAYFMYRISASQQYSQPLQYSLHQLLSLTRQFNCLDPRDRIYGLLGVATTDDLTKNIVPDYKKSAAQLYVYITRQIIAASKSLNVLSSVQRDSRNGSMRSFYNPRATNFDHDAPSWAPQWHFVISRSLAPLTPEVEFNASGRRPMQLQEHAQGEANNVLTVRGIVIGEARHVSWSNFSSFWRGEQPQQQGFGFWGTENAAPPKPSSAGAACWFDRDS